MKRISNDSKQTKKLKKNDQNNMEKKQCSLIFSQLNIKE
jgi:hypothetical protein